LKSMSRVDVMSDYGWVVAGKYRIMKKRVVVGIPAVFKMNQYELQLKPKEMR